MARSDVLASYPLSWPTGWPRFKGKRKDGLFSAAEQRENYVGRRSLTMQEAMKRVHHELGRLGINVIDDCVISTNLQINMSGLPRSDQGEPADPGVAIYWQKKGQPMRVMAIDIYSRTRDNVAAVAATLEAMRKIERHGGATILDRAFTGFTALPKPSGADWWEVLKLPRDATRAQIKQRFMELAQERHPDKPSGSDNAMAELNRARDQALQEVP